MSRHWWSAEMVKPPLVKTTFGLMSERVLAYSGKWDKILIATLHDGGYWLTDEQGNEAADGVTHWQALPEGPHESNT